jgi:outer membrane receptor protein involved in Fe transport
MPKTRRNNAIALRSVAAAVGLTLFSGGAAWAQQEALQEIIITATKREASLQDVALAVSAVTGEQLAEMAIKRFDDIEIPAVHIGQGGANDALFIRGIGSGFNSGFDQSAPIYIDGVWFGNAQSQRLAFLDVGQIEVLRGPQPTYLGKNAIAGAIAIVGARPTAEFSAELDVSYEFEAGERAIAASVSGPLNDRVRARAAVKSTEMNGYMKNLGTKRDDPSIKDLAGRISLEVDLTDDLQAFVKYEKLSYEQSGRFTQLLKCLPTAPRDPTVEDCVFDLNRAVTYNPDAFQPATNPFLPTRGGGPEFQDLTLDNALLRLDWDTGPAAVSFLAAHYSQDNYNAIKPDHSVLQRNALSGTNEVKLDSQELRAVSKGDGAFSWLAGVYHDEQKQDTSSRQVLLAPMAMATDSRSTQSAETWSAFAEVAYAFTDALTARLGVRYSQVEKTGTLDASLYRVNPTTNLFLGPALPILPLTLSRKDSSTDPALTLEWRPSADLLFYASYREGFKAGGIDLDLNTDVVADLQFRPEAVEYWEGGGKLTFLDGRARLNIAAFRGNYDDLQVTQLNADTGSFRVLNAGKVRSQGIELDGAFKATDYITLSFALTKLDSTYTSFKGAQCWQNPAQTVAQGCVQIGSVGGVPVFGQDLSGKSTSFAPDLSGTFSIDVRYPTGSELFGKGIDFRAMASVFHTDDFNTNFDADPLTVQEGYQKYDARLGLAASDGSWNLALVGRNLTNEITSHWIANAPSAGQAKFAQTDRPREFGIQFGVRF